MGLRRIGAAVCVLMLAVACGGNGPASDAAGQGGDAPKGRRAKRAEARRAQAEAAGADAGAQATPGEGAGAAASGGTPDILAREPVTERAEVLHVLIGWAELEPAYGGRMDERGKKRTKAEADALAGEILSRARGGEDFRSLMQTYSEDWASAQSGTSYPVSPEAQLVPQFKALSLRLEPGETGLVQTDYGWHVIQRID